MSDEKTTPRTFPYPFGPVPPYIDETGKLPVPIHVLSESLERIANSLEYFVERQKAIDAQQAAFEQERDALYREARNRGWSP